MQIPDIYIRFNVAVMTLNVDESVFFGLKSVLQREFKKFFNFFQKSSVILTLLLTDENYDVK